MIIDDFEGEHRFLSNFYLHPIEFDGKIWPTSEHLYQAMKTRDDDEAEEVRLCETPGVAKKLGQHVTKREDWDFIKVNAMECVLRLKFSNPKLKEMLLSTGDAELIEGNWWNDKFWGVCRGEGQNHLGKLLMKLRNEFKS